MQDALVNALKETEGSDFSKGLTRLYEGLANDFVYANPNQVLLLGDNHDMDRLYMQLNQDMDLTKMAVTYLLTIRGIPQIYYGTEILMDNTGHHKVDGLIRSDFPGGWEEDTINAFTGTGLNSKQLSMQSYLKELLNWRKNNPDITSGQTLHFAPFNGVYVYFRYSKEKIIMVVLNKNNTATSIEASRFAEILKGKKAAINALTKETVDIKSTITVNPRSATLLEIK
jgi:glycosidase